jgi:hypothetical protein
MRWSLFISENAERSCGVNNAAECDSFPGTENIAPG